eukprot:TRINITY_DN5859_c0_g1_i1.p1 TRINITY_DN5859_c0_g1~~TRINITY_DN5859_c0_g1_i1.p1  ORF type:complete len:413 (-),score=108.05 TRINITY_DN5859_c0_g1_i1:340-1578(-)
MATPAVDPADAPHPVSELTHDEVSGLVQALGDVTELHCPLCSAADAKPLSDHQAALRHLVLGHKLVIGDVDKVADLAKYLMYYRERLLQHDIREFVTVIHTRTSVDGPPDVYHLLADALPEDKLLREELSQQRLQKMIAVQQRERSDSHFARKCLFCKLMFQGNRAELVNHMFHVHHFNLGRPDNLVNVDELLDLLQQRIDTLQCLFCERTFKAHDVLKSHMRKKRHLRIDSKNHSYDRFYMINYLEPGRNWEEIHKEKEEAAASDDSSDDDGEWGDWAEIEAEETRCLFCSHIASSAQQSLQHAQTVHDFDFWALRRDWSLKMYDCIKLINYIRRQISLNRCPSCDGVCKDNDTLLRHMMEEKHFQVQHDAPFWSDAQYFFPTDDNDPMLTTLPLDDDADEPFGADVQVRS